MQLNIFLEKSLCDVLRLLVSYGKPNANYTKKNSTKACGGILPNHYYKPFFSWFGLII